METPESKNKTRLLLLGTLIATIVLSIPLAVTVVRDLEVQENIRMADVARMQSLNSIGYALAQYARDNEYVFPQSLDALGDLSAQGLPKEYEMYVGGLSYTRGEYGAFFTLCVTLSSGEENCIEEYVPERPRVSAREEVLEEVPEESLKPVSFSKGIFSNPSYGITLRVPTNWTMATGGSHKSATLFAPAEESNILVFMNKGGSSELKYQADLTKIRLKGQVADFSLISEKEGELLGVPTYEFVYTWTGSNGVKAKTIVVGLYKDGYHIEMAGTTRADTYNTVLPTFTTAFSSLTLTTP